MSGTACATYHAELTALPFFGPQHCGIAAGAEAWARRALDGADHPTARDAVDRRCQELVRMLGADGLLRHCVRAEHGGAALQFDVRAVCLIRETLAYHDALADFAFAMQGLGSGALSVAASPELAARYLPRVCRGESVAAFALSEPQAGSDVAAMTTRAAAQGGHYILDGTKTWISNGGIADFYCVFARTADGEVRSDGSVGAQGISAFLVEPGDPGFSIEERIDVMAPHPLARLRFSGCRIPADRRIGAEGEGFKIAMRTLDIFRSSVAAAALGFARRAFDEAVAHVKQRTMFGRTLADFQLTQAALADMAAGIDAAALLTYRAAWLKDRGDPVTTAAAMAKMAATEIAQSVIDRALQMFGGSGLVSGGITERLYRDIRALRIYEGATEVQKLIIARGVCK
jgi:acyl-CoA dehydrogenase